MNKKIGMMMKVDIAIPVLNEEATLESNVSLVVNYLSGLSLPFHFSIVIADNGSVDKTESIALELCQKYSMVRYIKVDRPGVGRALKAAWGASDADIVGYFDLDLATDLSHIPQALDILGSGGGYDGGGYDIVAGSRLERGSQVIGRSFLREVVSRCFNFLLKLFFRNKFSDGMCGFKFLKRKAYSELRSVGLVSDGWFFATEMLVTAENFNMPIYNLPVKWTDDPNSKAKILKLAMQYLSEMIALRKRLKSVRG